MEHDGLASATTDLRLLRRRDVERLTGYKRSTIYQLMATGAFPSVVRLGPRSVAWRSDEVAGWIQARIAASRPAAPAARTAPERRAP